MNGNRRRVSQRRRQGVEVLKSQRFWESSRDSKLMLAKLTQQVRAGLVA